MAECALVHTTEHCIIPAVREAYIQPFTAPNWLELRVGFFLSVTDETLDDNPNEAGMEDTISDIQGLGSAERYWIGLKTVEDALPRTSGVVFMGYTNSMHAPITLDNGREHLGDTALFAAGGTNYWLPYNTEDNQWSGGIFDGTTWRAANVTYQQQFFARNTATVAAGYATLLAIKLVRSGQGLRRVTMSMKRDTDEGSNILLSNTPTSDIIESNLIDFPASVGSYGPFQVSRAIDDLALYFYWPFTTSRLRVHAIGIYKAQ